MLRDSIIQHLGSDWTRLNELISCALVTDIPLLQEVNAGILEHSGKMLRPMLSLLVARCLGGGVAGEDAIRYAAAAELLHNATLLHDDVADESPTRRGAPTLSALVGPKAAVLVGDFWLSRAMEVTLGTRTKDKVVGVFSKAMTNLAEGEMLQLQNANGEGTGEEDYFRIIYCKTASLFETACISAAIASEADDRQVEAVKEYAVSLGIAFQIRDDILDYVGDGTLGKPVGIDIKEHKITLPLLCCLRESSREAEIRRMVAQSAEHPEYCTEIRRFVLENGGADKAEQVLDEYVDRALTALRVLPEGADRDYLGSLAKYNSKRSF